MELLKELLKLNEDIDSNRLFQSHERKDWEIAAKAHGAVLEPSGDGKIIAHVDGDEIGYWDPKYGGTGMGFFYKKKKVA